MGLLKPAWVDVQPQGGSRDTHIDVTGGMEHTGRSQRSGVVVYEADGATDESQTINQAGRAEFVTLSNVSVAKGGGNVTVQGSSNSSKLTFTLGDGDIEVQLPANYTAAGASTANGAAVAGDPGDTAAFDFAITLNIPANATVSEQSRVVSATANGGQVATATITQAAGDPTLSVTPSVINLNNAGDVESATVQTNTNWRIKVVPDA